MSNKPNATPAKPSAAPAEAASQSHLAPINANLSKDAKIGLYRTMVRIRRFEERSLRAYQAKKIGGFLHLYIGQEAVAVGCCSLKMWLSRCRSNKGSEKVASSTLIRSVK